MPTRIDYYMVPQSPFVYLGHQRLMQIASKAGAQVRLLPFDLGKVFTVSGGLPLGQRAPQRRAYRLLELRRFSEALGLPMHIEPAFFPVAGDDAARLLIAVDAADGTEAALRLARAVTRAVWEEQRNIADVATLGELLAAENLPASRIEESKSAQVQQTYDANTQQAIDTGIFGAPSFVIDGELFWGQDRLDFVERKLPGSR
ncbi:2-hydroxychromene-2-carboxylate isomerase [Piscinibacter sakaiensis]|uniref:2-hydroxychromene-2-carboxylate isomerase n=1 Tax=Piscinibacter sakaiensis TaxID=1547922 RepID=UPI003AAAF456